ncbi:hypothetical protein KDH_55830 [Dictyobacter sp. S3.2.2.5]|uniref:HTH araC/xylS-type domain-containing protein n=1 Tax=Dictyobacter halimunensis TaxID=3026934 RepID=A0ABQ6FWV3_9CHLR|nr:hypothetical protein KDH_55830 [Dictyobacter sp. S3.2.2.5]
MPEIVHEQIQLSLYIVEQASYVSLNIVDQVYPHWVLSYVACGDVVTSCCGESWRARAGDVMIHPPQLPFSEQATGPGTHQWLLLDAVTARQIDLFQLYPVSPVVSLTRSIPFSAVFERLYASWSDMSLPYRHIQVSADVLQMCCLVLESWRQGGSIPRSDALLTPRDRFTDVIRYMSEHLAQKLTRDELAAQVYLHPGYFDRAFRHIYGIAPMQMLRDLRLQEAQRLLETTDLSLQAISLQCGLSDAGYFSRVFRQRFGQPPGTYRESTKSAKESYLHPL